MIRYIQLRILRAIPVLLGISVIVFMMLHLVPGDPVTAMLNESSGASAEAVELKREQLGLNDPLYVQYFRFLKNAVRGDFGNSIISGRDVTGMILDVLPATLQLTFAAMGIAIVSGVTLGVLAAVFRGKWVDSLSMVISLIGVSVPVFFLGIIFIYLFSIRLNLVPVTSSGGGARIILPAITLGLGSAAIITRLVRTSLLEVLRQEYIQTARAKGLSEQKTIVVHGLRNALIPVVTIVGLQFGALLGGAVITETVFARRGIGQLAVNAVIDRDFPLVQGTILLSAAGYLLINLLVDVSYAWLDPRVQVTQG